MDYEKKYKEVKALIEDCIPDEDGYIHVKPSDICPELAESEDERIRKEIIEYLRYQMDRFSDAPNVQKKHEYWIAWLEKQGEHNNWKPSKEEMDVLYGLAYITNQYDEHKEEVITHLYQDLKREFFNGSSYENMFPNTEDGVRRRSTIQILEYARSLDTYNQYGKADIDKNIAWLERQGEQKMKTPEESLDIDSDTYNKIVDECIYGEQKPTDKLDLKKIEWNDCKTCGFRTLAYKQNTAWTYEDEKRLTKVLVTLNDAYASKELLDWVESLKDRVQPKQEWSEQEQVRINRIVACLENLNVADNDILLKDVEWLKSLRPQNRWKPSEEQMKAVRIAAEIGTANNSWAMGILNGMYNDLKKLRGE